MEVSCSPHIDEGNLDRAYEALTSCAAQGLEVDRVSLWFFEEGNQALHCHWLFEDGEHWDAPGAELHRKDYPIYFDALENQRAIAAAEAKTHPDTQEFAADYLPSKRIAAMLDCPIRHRGKIVGVFCCEHRRPIPAWHRDQISFAVILADLVGRALNANSMTLAQQELSNLNNQLEERVRHRTHALNETLERMKKTQERMIQTEKMAHLGSMVAGIAHEVNTPLSVAILAGTSLQEKYEELLSLYEELVPEVPDPLLHYLEHSRECLPLLSSNLHRAAELISDFKMVASEQSQEGLQEFNLPSLLNNLIHSLAPETKKIPVSPTLTMPDDLTLRSYPAPLLQIFTNLIINSCRHAFVGDEAPSISIEAGIGEGPNVWMSYRDNGVGVPDDIKAKVFDFFFTTKRNQGGTGLGLSIVHNLVVHQLSGQLEFKTNPGRGVHFHILIPKESIS